MIGCAHGRFQPLHNEHLFYLLTAMEQCEHLVIGITQPDIECLSSIHNNAKRTSPRSNPLTYHERVDMIKYVFESLEINSHRYSFKKFYIDEPDKLFSEGISKDWLFFTTIREEWNKDKIALLQSFNLKIKVLYEDYSSDRITSTTIREKTMVGDPSWKELVPESCSVYLEKISFSKRFS
ncbi:adenylyltransferase/cytidyltransferase family protein [Vibrio ruber]|uniref:adenylyltransferase/cytidyltransferase family protein n=1 Tax=Vibrio ruber TaxID=184755 RepID=UPI0028937F4B|nr:adenylyltransferase/cytidyltransferase family protein [Vibrio ruber]WNJ95372.1 adenylyltransferase/cytidyltransferase family protein [Vibrio ruber]